tara:strand:+ start:579 stop:695 length:117 start_codon:yes stop_codon:yes gene_type:complete
MHRVQLPFIKNKKGRLLSGLYNSKKQRYCYLNYGLTNN